MVWWKGRKEEKGGGKIAFVKTKFASRAHQHDHFWSFLVCGKCPKVWSRAHLWKKLGEFPSYSFITFATMRLCHDTSSATSPSVFRERECSHLFLSHYIWESGSLKAQIWSLIGVEYERLPMLPYSTLTYPFDPTAAIRGGVLHLCSRVYRHGSASW